jgi:hypothetical protein
MNIFYLHEDPVIAASMHCDQHLGKMILENAQMLSTITNTTDVYKPTHSKHPCVLWLQESFDNIAWVCELSYALEDIRQSCANVAEHASIPVIRHCEDWLTSNKSCAYINARGIFCGPAMFKPPYFNGSISEAYKKYYLYKAKQWALDGKPRMSYKGRSIPDFLKDCEYLKT